jgi:hypothetical protein
MFGPSKAEIAHAAFLQRQLAVLEEALKPAPRIDYNRELTAVCLAKKTSLVVIHPETNTCDSFPL